jgi:predicted ATPase
MTQKSAERLNPGFLAKAHHLPAEPTSFVGREKELAELLRLLTNPNCRLLTLVGPGGIGKTRLAIQAARAFQQETAQAVYFVPLQSVSSGEGLISAVVDALKFPLSGQAAPQLQLLHYLRDKTLLLILDNFEQFLGAGGALFLPDLLEAAPSVKLLVTSREVLNLQEEWLYPVQALPYPGDVDQTDDITDYSAIQLFVERAQRVRRDFSLVEEQTSVSRICRLVEGMPLAIELAASWTKTMPCALIAAEIERSLNFLTSKLRNLPEQHRSMRAVFDHSWALLSPEEQRVFKRLSIFRGGFRREAAEQVAGASLLNLSALVDKSLLRWDPDGRYQIHELLRQYAEEHLHDALEELADIHYLHCAYYANFLESRWAGILAGKQREVRAEITADLDNIRAAW